MATIQISDPRGTFSKQRLDAMPARARKEMIRKARAGMRATAPRMQASLQGHVGMALKGNKAAKSMRAKVFASKPQKFPAMQVHSKIPWLGVHERGRRIQGQMLIQIGRGKGRRGAFRAMVDRLNAQGLTFWNKVDGQLFLFAKAPKGTRGLAGAKRAERERRRSAGGSGRLGRDEAFPIAMLVRSVDIRRRLNVEGTIRKNMPILTRAMEVAA